MMLKYPPFNVQAVDMKEEGCRHRHQVMIMVGQTHNPNKRERDTCHRVWPGWLGDNAARGAPSIK